MVQSVLFDVIKQTGYEKNDQALRLIFKEYAKTKDGTKESLTNKPLAEGFFTSEHMRHMY